LNDSLKKNTLFDETATRAEIRDWEISWTRNTNGHFQTEPRGDAVAISQKLFEKYASDASRPLTVEMK
jgi:hypothetical protein